MWGILLGLLIWIFGIIPAFIGEVFKWLFNVALPAVFRFLISLLPYFFVLIVLLGLGFLLWKAHMYIRELPRPSLRQWKSKLPGSSVSSMRNNNVSKLQTRHVVHKCLGCGRESDSVDMPHRLLFTTDCSQCGTPTKHVRIPYS